MSKSSERCFCAFCRSERNVYRKRHVSFVDVALALLTSLLVSFIAWQEFDPRFVVIFALASGIAELFIVLRWRLSIACPKCGFDPVLYKKKPALAAARVKEYYKSRMEDPLSVFSPPPRLPFVSNSKASQDARAEASR